ncbi:hypothetical protein [Plantactinospora sp. B5E13]|uniref:hypothetical protein n=1 Tax=Plantactinospora sp. B5E13 TaxID=3153758 RepID=UPI00325E4239
MIAGLALADFRDRVRRPAYAVTLLAAVGLGYLAAPAADARWVILDLAGYRGIYDSAYVGAVIALAGALWLSICGFYVVRGAIQRDERTGVGQVLAATPVSRAAYLLGKFTSNLLVFASMTGVLAVTALVMQLARGESRTVDPVDLLAPFVLLTLPVLALTAAAALLFDAVRPLSGGLGNVTWFFVWMVLAIVSQASGALLGGLGMGYIADSARADLAARGVAVSGAEFGLGLMNVEQPLRTFDWSGLDLGAGLVTERLGIVLVALAVAALPALWFHRFDTARATGTPAPADAVPPFAPTVAYPGLPRTAVRRGSPAVRLFAGELRILVQGVGRWWWFGTVVLVVVGLAAPPAMGLLLAGIWPVLVWSRLGTQPVENNTSGLLGAYPAARRRLLAEWAAGIAIAALVGAGPTVRMLVTGDAGGLVAWVAGAVFIASLALALGVVGRTQRLFQALYVPLWYLVVNDAAALDYLGVIRGGPAPGLVAGAGAVLLTVAVVVSGVRHARR